MYSNNRDAYRQAFFTAWQKYQKNLPLETVEAQLVEIMLLHPEYHALLETHTQEFALEENPFFHLGLHLALRDQIRMNRPAGIAVIQQELIADDHDAHEIEHRMMQCLAQLLWQGQQTGSMPTDEEYLRKLRELRGSHT